MNDEVLIRAATEPSIWLPNKVYFIKKNGNDYAIQYVTNNLGEPTYIGNRAVEDQVDELIKTGWIYFVNTLHTEQNPYFFSASQEFTFPLRNDFNLDSNSPAGLGNFIDNESNKLSPPNEGDNIEIRVEFFLKTDVADRKGKFNMDIGVVDRFNPRKFTGSDDAGIAEQISVDFPMFIGKNFINNGGELKCTIDGNGSVYNISAYVRKIRHGEDI